ncbi:hypothetical protein Rhe02_38040 [Rhizocola hellebori]|uniref:Nucleoside phosphorylase domain-containing protein n=1 Tax=Rhizocola hellebori TaxID=1392758 RepID=A0A8J3Q9L5_9ACTN|nr:hypothetical protein Rhe02_38040 [Rhizocola hellebori]
MWTVAVARPTEMGGRQAAPIATSLVNHLRPKYLAMCGVCAGNPAYAALGDVVVAAMVYQWDEGRHSPSRFEGDHRQVLLDPRWLRAAQDFNPAGLPSFGLATEDDAMLWLLERLHQNVNPREHPARNRYFPDGEWEPRLDRFEAKGLIARDDRGAVVITDAGAGLVRRRIYGDVDGPQQLPFRVLVAPMASGNTVMKDGGIWEQLAGMGVRKIAAVDMEAAAIATVARELQVAHWLVVKGVMDHASPDKDDRHMRFAARASAEVLFKLLDQLVVADQYAPVESVARRAMGRWHRATMIGLIGIAAGAINLIGNSAHWAPTTTPATSPSNTTSATPPTTVPSSLRLGLPANCDAVLTLAEITPVLGSIEGEPRVSTDGENEQLNRAGKITCQYGRAFRDTRAGNVAPLIVGISDYTDASMAIKRRDQYVTGAGTVLSTTTRNGIIFTTYVENGFIMTLWPTGKYLFSVMLYAETGDAATASLIADAVHRHSVR